MSPNRTTLTGVFSLIAIGGAWIMFKADNPIERRMGAVVMLVGVIDLLALGLWGWLRRR